jgi:hypothetical protein
MIDQDYANRVLAVLRSNPTAQNLDFLVQAYATLGYVAADAEGIAERAEFTRKYHEAQHYLAEKRRGERITERMAESVATIETKEQREAEIEARTSARKMKNLLFAVEQAINAIKHLDRIGPAPGP